MCVYMYIDVTRGHVSVRRFKKSSPLEGRIKGQLVTGSQSGLGTIAFPIPTRRPGLPRWSVQRRRRLPAAHTANNAAHARTTRRIYEGTERGDHRTSSSSAWARMMRVAARRASLLRSLTSCTSFCRTCERKTWLGANGR